VNRADRITANCRTKKGKTMTEAEMAQGGLMRVSRAGEHLDLSRARIWELIRQGQLRSIKIGGARRVYRDSVIALATSGLEAN
jgi:excisionase family DNA binding protein